MKINLLINSHLFVCLPCPATPGATFAKSQHGTTSLHLDLVLDHDAFSFLIFFATSTILSNTFDLLHLPNPILEFDLLHLPDPILEFDLLYNLWFWLNLACGLRALRLWMLPLLLSGLIYGLAKSTVVELFGLIGCCWVGWFWLISMGNWLLLVGIFILIVVVSWIGFSMEVELILVFGYLLGISVQIWKREA